MRMKAKSRTTEVAIGMGRILGEERPKRSRTMSEIYEKVILAMFGPS